MKTKDINELRLSKTTIANLNTHEMKFINGGFDLAGDDLPLHLYTDSCNPCHLPGEPIYPFTYGDCTHTCSC